MPAVQKRRSRLILFLFCSACWLAVRAGAEPIKYQLTVPVATVQIGSQTYSGDQVVFTFTGDDTNVFSGSIPDGPGSILTYAAIYQGDASVTVIGSGGVLASAIFAPNQIVVSIDHRNEGVGFGFVPGGIGASGFDVMQLQPLYPAGISNYNVFPGSTTDNWAAYDLTLAYARSQAPFASAFQADGSADILAAVYACNQFGGSIFSGGCASPAPIQTNLGDFTINPIFEPTTVGSQRPLYTGEFTAAPNNVPEPGTLSLLCLGLAGLHFARRHKAKLT